MLDALVRSTLNAVTGRRHFKCTVAMLCPECGSDLVEKSGKYGDFLGCASWQSTGCSGSLNRATRSGKYTGFAGTASTKQARKYLHSIRAERLWSREKVYALATAELGRSIESVSELTETECLLISKLILRAESKHSLRRCPICDCTSCTHDAEDECLRCTGCGICLEGL